MTKLSLEFFKIITRLLRYWHTIVGSLSHDFYSIVTSLSYYNCHTIVTQFLHDCHTFLHDCNRIFTRLSRNFRIFYDCKSTGSGEPGATLVHAQSCVAVERAPDGASVTVRGRSTEGVTAQEVTATRWRVLLIHAQASSLMPENGTENYLLI